MGGVRIGMRTCGACEELDGSELNVRKERR